MKAEVITGDAVEKLKDLSDGSIDLTVTSPPYDNLRTYNGYSFDFEGIAKELFRVTKQGGVVVWVVGDATIDGSETGTSFRQALYFKDVCGFNLHDTMIYQKTGCAMPSPNRYLSNFEYMFVLSKGSPATANLIEDRVNRFPERWGGGRKVRDKNGEWSHRGNYPAKELGRRFNVWQYNNGGQGYGGDMFAALHPATFPELLAYDHILSWSNEGDTVLDPMCGSGTTGKMAVIAKRNSINIDISEEYCEIARARIKRAQGIPCDIPRLIKNEKPLPLFWNE